MLFMGITLKWFAAVAAHAATAPSASGRVEAGLAPSRRRLLASGPPSADPQTFQVIIPCAETPEDAVLLFQDLKESGLRPTHTVCHALLQVALSTLPGVPTTARGCRCPRGWAGPKRTTVGASLHFSACGI